MSLILNHGTITSPRHSVITPPPHHGAIAIIVGICFRVTVVCIRDQDGVSLGLWDRYQYTCFDIYIHSVICNFVAHVEVVNPILLSGLEIISPNHNLNQSSSKGQNDMNKLHK